MNPQSPTSYFPSYATICHLHLAVKAQKEGSRGTERKPFCPLKNPKQKSIRLLTREHIGLLGSKGDIRTHIQNDTLYQINNKSLINEHFFMTNDLVFYCFSPATCHFPLKYLRSLGPEGFSFKQTHQRQSFMYYDAFTFLSSTARSLMVPSSCRLKSPPQ